MCIQIRPPAEPDGSYWLFNKELVMSQQRMGFGPWSSALDNGTRLELSAFWRRRMAGLGRLPLGRRMSRRWTAVGAIAALLVGATPLIEFSSRAVADEELAAVEKPAGRVEGEEFVWRFSNGLEVELIGLAKNPSKGEMWWRPDGTPLKNASLPAARFSSDGSDVREIAYRWRHVPADPDQTRSWHTAPNYSGAGGGVTENEAGGSILEIVGASFHGGPKEIAVTFTASVSSTPWRTAFESDGRNPMSAGSAIGGKIRSVAFASTYETKTGVAITVSYGVGEDSGRVIAIDKAGQEHLATRQRGVGSTHFDQTTFEFDKLAPDDIERFELQTQSRMLETVEFRNVAMNAGQETNVRIGSPVSADPQALQFGDVIERFVKDDRPDVGDFLIDFETGKVFSPPQEVEGAEISQWVKENGVDAMGEMKSSVQGLLGFDMIVIPTAESNWDPSPRIFAQLDEGTLGTPAVMSGRGELPATYHFQTREGSRGALQILEVKGHEGVKIRYKLAEK
jgi:hypothetical protein